MISIKACHVVLLALLCAIVLTAAPAAVAQDSPVKAVAGEDVNLDTSLYLILATNRDVEDGKLNPAVEPIVKRLREALPFKHYAVVGTFLNRVKNNGRLDVSWVGSPFMVPSAAPAALNNPSFNNFGAVVRLVTDSSGSDLVRMSELKFGAQLPIITAQATTTNASMGSTPIATVQYQNIGLRTDISMREGSPVIAGTLSVGPQGDAVVVAVAARRAN
ncbi:MAG TPA: hypothetical protein VE961_20970 [Pyrinomonadaceae bacterium]|nr:hypothetical protein [Pyrinomonadaceae bacterium]